MRNYRHQLSNGSLSRREENIIRSPSQLLGADILFLEDDAIISISTCDALEEMQPGKPHIGDCPTRRCWM
jgi:hypothetical protein